MNSRVQVPGEAKKGEIVAVRIAIQHPMESGFRHDDLGRAIPKNVINRLTCRYNGAEIFRAEMSSGIAANPYLQFYTVAEASGTLEFDWMDDEGNSGSAQAALAVKG